MPAVRKLHTENSETPALWATGIPAGTELPPLASLMTVNEGYDGVWPITRIIHN